MAIKTYQVKPGKHHGAFNQYGPGSILELEESEAQGFLDKLQEVLPDPVELEPVAESESVVSKPAADAAPVASKGKGKAK